MAETLQRFIASLRDHELPIATAESLDALRVAALLGYADKQRLRLGLRAALVKHSAHLDAFETCFAQFFSAADPADGVPPQGAPGLSADSAPTGDGPSADAPALVVARAAAQLDFTPLRHATQRGLYLYRLLEIARADSRAAGTPAYRNQLEAAARAHVERILALTAQAAPRRIQQQMLKRMNLSMLEQRQHQAMQELIQQLARNLARQTRRRRRRAQRGQLDMGKTLRRNLPHQGIPMALHWRQVKPRRAKLFVCCDISGSVARHARWLLLFLYSLGEVLPATRSFVFTNTTTEVSDLFAQHGAADAIDRALRRYALGGSDYGTSLASLYGQIGGALRRNSTVLILGDARNNHAEPRVDLLQRLSAQAGRLIWLNPEPQALWDSGDSVAGTYRRICHRFVECASLQQLEKAVARLLEPR
ncbi:MAG TPA: VWA domain-containing protein [Spongiibacteraceae bacterium]|nr:VWA domain-containing protein [Spongiibacteraceae bacterium]HUH37911.1 VWA domain-containing protein [Spongiibacteraceae bacterium]